VATAAAVTMTTKMAAAAATMTETVKQRVGMLVMRRIAPTPQEQLSRAAMALFSSSFFFIFLL